MAAAFGRLCVETGKYQYVLMRYLAAAFGRLCVETIELAQDLKAVHAAAFGRLCVETRWRLRGKSESRQPPSGGCVLKHLGDEWKSH